MEVVVYHGDSVIAHRQQLESVCEESPNGRSISPLGARAVPVEKLGSDGTDAI